MQRKPSNESGPEASRSSKSDQSSKDSLAPPGSELPGDDDSKISRPLGTSKSCDGIVRAIRSRIQAIRAGELLSIMFMR